MKIIINNVLLHFVKQEDFLQAEKYIDLFLVLDNAFVSMSVCVSWPAKATFKFSYQATQAINYSSL